jgi:hypothetical protein
MERIRSRCAFPWVLAFVLVVAPALLVAPASAMASGTITGWVRAGDSTPLLWATVTAVDKGTGLHAGQTSTFLTGQYSLTLPDGQYVLGVGTPADSTPRHAYTFCGVADRKPFYGLVTDPITVAGDTATVDVTPPLMSNLTVRVKRPGLTGAPAAGVEVWLHYRDGGMYYDEPTWMYEKVLTDAGGLAYFEDVFPGDWRVYVEDDPLQKYPRYQVVFSPPLDPESGRYFTVAPGALTGVREVEMSKFASATADIAGGSVWQKDPGDGVAITFTKDSGDLGPANLFYDIIGVVGPVNAGSGDSTTTKVTKEGEYLALAYTRLVSDGTVGPYDDTHYVRIDNTAPHSTAVTDARSHPFEMTAEDPLPSGVLKNAGVAHMWYTDDGVGPFEYTTPVTLPYGMHSISYWAEDAAGNVEAAHSGLVASGPQPGITTPSGRSSVRVNRYLTFRGKLTARVRNHTKLTLMAYRFNGADWVLTRTKTVTVHTPRRRGRPTYSGSIKFTAKGSWKVVAYYKGDGYWAPAFSAPKYVTVK